MANKYKVTVKKGKEKEETEIDAADELHATRMLALLHGGTVHVEGMYLSCEKCKTTTFHEYNEGAMSYRQFVYIFGTGILGILLMVVFTRIVPEEHIPSSMNKILMVIFFGGAFVICKAILLPLFLSSTHWTCKECGEDWDPRGKKS